MLSAEMTNKVIDDPLKKILGEQSFDISVGIASLRMGIMSWNPEHAITSLKHNEKNENLRAQAYKKHVTKQSFVHGVVAQMPVAAEVGSGDERDELGSG